MKSHTHPSLLSFRSLRRTLFAAACLSAVAVSAKAQTLVTSFENPPFTSGTVVNGLGNWVSSTGVAANTNSSPTDTLAYNGSQSLRINNISGGTAFFNYTYYDAAGEFIYDSLADTGSFSFTLNGTTSFAPDISFARFDVIYSSTGSADAASNYRIGMSLRYGDLVTDPYELTFFNTGSTNALASAATLSVDQSFLNMGTGWNQFSLTLDHATNQAVVSLNGNALTGVALNATNFDTDSHVSGFRFTANNATGANGTTYYDYITVVPEPSTALLTSCGLGLFALRRRKRIG